MKWGILGAARIARDHLVHAIREAGGTVEMVAARDPEKARQFAQDMDIEHAGSYAALLEHPDLEVVYVPLPNSEHLEWTVKALEAGKHVLCEKPLTLNVQQAQQMLEAQKGSGKLVLEAFSYRYHPQITEMLEVLQSGEIGDIRAMRSVFAFNLDRPDDIRWDPKLGGGALYDVGSYCIDLMRLTTGELPKNVQAMAHMTDRQVDTTTSALLEFSGCIGQLVTSFELPFQQGFEVLGTKGSLQLDAPFANDDYEATLTVNGKARKFDKVNVYAEMVRHFEKAISGKTPLKYPLETDAMVQMQALEQVLCKINHPAV